MSNNLTPEDMADYNVQVSTIEGTKSYSLRAAYTTIEPGTVSKLDGVPVSSWLSGHARPARTRAPGKD